MQRYTNTWFTSQKRIPRSCENFDYELMSDTVYFIQSDENVKTSPPLEQICSQGEDWEGAFDTLDEIEMVTLPVTSISQGH